MPKPIAGEGRDDFVERCMANDVMVDDFEDGEQRFAVCNQIWRDREKSGGNMIEHKIFQAEIEVKVLNQKTGHFSGYASMFGNVDLGGDVIVREAFKEFVRNKDGKVKVLYSHDSGQGLFGGATGSGGLPIGLASVEQNSKGLKFDGDLVMDDPFVQRVHAHMSAGSLDGMSIGYDVLPGGAKILESGVRELSALRLWEISPVVWGMNPKAHIADVKSVQTIREVEDWLREAVGLSKSQASKHAGDIWRTLSGRRESDDVSDQTRQMLNHILSNL